MLQEGCESIRLSGNINIKELVTGIVLAVLGHEDEETNTFVVEDHCFCGPIATPMLAELQTENKYVLLVSGLGFSRNPTKELLYARENLVDYLTGGLDGEMDSRFAGVCRVIIAGNLVGKKVKKEETELMRLAGPDWSNRNRAYSTNVIKEADEWLVKLARHIEIDILPGETDPCSMLLPQQALHPAMLPQCSQLNSVRCVTNPYSARIDNILFTGSSGQSVDNIRAFSEMDESVEIMQKQLEWNHIAPTAPDCLHCYPFIEQDPFIFPQRPHVYFAGNQPSFNTLRYEPEANEITRIVSFPDFETQMLAVLIRLNDLSCSLVSFA